MECKKREGRRWLHERDQKLMVHGGDLSTVVTSGDLYADAARLF